MHIVENHGRTSDLITMECEEKFSKRDRNGNDFYAWGKTTSGVCVCARVHAYMHVCTYM